MGDPHIYPLTKENESFFNDKKPLCVNVCTLGNLENGLIANDGHMWE
jgi:hypothetical protein